MNADAPQKAEEGTGSLRAGGTGCGEPIDVGAGDTTCRTFQEYRVLSTANPSSTAPSLFC